MLNDSTEPSIYKLSSRAPRFFLPGHRRIFLLIVRIWTVYTASILLASSRILIAAFRSLSISFPHVQRYTLSDNPSSFFIFPHLLHFLLEGKKRSIFINSFPFTYFFNWNFILSSGITSPTASSIFHRYSSSTIRSCPYSVLTT